MGYFDIASENMSTTSVLIKERLNRVYLLGSNIICIVPGDIIAVVF